MRYRRVKLTLPAPRTACLISTLHKLRFPFSQGPAGAFLQHGRARNAYRAVFLAGRTGRGRGARTPDLRFWRPPLYQLSYTPSPCLSEVRNAQRPTGNSWRLLFNPAAKDKHFPARNLPIAGTKSRKWIWTRTATTNTERRRGQSAPYRSARAERASPVEATALPPDGATSMRCPVKIILEMKRTRTSRTFVFRVQFNDSMQEVGRAPGLASRGYGKLHHAVQVQARSSTSALGLPLMRWASAASMKGLIAPSRTSPGAVLSTPVRRSLTS